MSGDINMVKRPYGKVKIELDLEGWGCLHEVYMVYMVYMMFTWVETVAPRIEGTKVGAV